MSNDISAAVDDGGVSAFAEGNLLLQFGDIANAHSAHGNVSATKGFDEKNSWPPFRVAHNVAKPEATLGDQFLQR